MTLTENDVKAIRTTLMERWLGYVRYSDITLTAVDGFCLSRLLRGPDHTGSEDCVFGVAKMNIILLFEMESLTSCLHRKMQKTTGELLKSGI